MRVVLVYDECVDPLSPGELPEDSGAEYEDPRTIEALLGAIGSGGHEAIGLALDEDLARNLLRLSPDLVFNIAEGVRGPARESIVPGWLDHLAMDYTGSDGLTLALSLDKALTKSLAAAHGVRTPAFWRVSGEAELAALDVPLPAFVKPNGEGSSMGITDSSRVETPEDLARQVRWVVQTYHQDCLVEEFAPGREFCVGLLGNASPQVLPIVEVRTDRDFYAYEDKRDHRKQLLCPAEIAPELAERMTEMAVAVFDVLGCRDLARVDFKLDNAGEPTFLETNPLPGLSPYYSIFPCQAEAGGYNYEQLIQRIIELAVLRARERKERTTAV